MASITRICLSSLITTPAWYIIYSVLDSSLSFPLGTEMAVLSALPTIVCCWIFIVVRNEMFMVYGIFGGIFNFLNIWSALNVISEHKFFVLSLLLLIVLIALRFQNRT